MRKINKEWKECQEIQQKRLNEETSMIRVHTYDEQERHILRIACCAYWDFVDCIDRAVKEICVVDKWGEVSTYVNQLGAGVSVSTCHSEYPRDSYICSMAGALFSSTESSINLTFIHQIPIILLLSFSIMFCFIFNSRF